MKELAMLSCDTLKISVLLAVSLTHNIIFAKFLKILLSNNVISSRTNVRWQNKSHSEVIWVQIFRFLIKSSTSSKYFLKYTLEIQHA